MTLKVSSIVPNVDSKPLNQIKRITARAVVPVYQIDLLWWDTFRDKQGEKCDAIRFKLKSDGGTEIKIEEGSPASLSESELFEKVKESAPITLERTSSSGSGSGLSYSRSEVVKEFALCEAAGISQECKKEAHFYDKSGVPFLMSIISIGGVMGPDDPENVITLCPNCHHRLHHGKYGEQFNKRLLEQVWTLNNRLIE